MRSRRFAVCATTMLFAVCIETSFLSCRAFDQDPTPPTATIQKAREFGAAYGVPTSQDPQEMEPLRDSTGTIRVWRFTWHWATGQSGNCGESSGIDVEVDSNQVVDFSGIVGPIEHPLNVSESDA